MVEHIEIVATDKGWLVESWSKGKHFEREFTNDHIMLDYVQRLVLL